MRNTKQVHTSTSRRYLKRRKPRDRSSETEGGCSAAIVRGNGGSRQSGREVSSAVPPLQENYLWDRPQDAKLDGQSWWPRSMSAFYFWPSTIHLSPAAHMGTVDQLTTGQFQFMIESPMLLAIRWAHAHDNPSPPMLHPIPRRRIIRE